VGIGEGKIAVSEVFITAEIGINHGGLVDTAKKLIEAAKWAGASAVKLQKRTVATVYAGELDKPRESPWGKTLGDQKFGLELNREQYDQIDLYCEQLDIPWYASAWDVEALEFLSHYGCKWNKIASAMATHWPLVAAVAAQKKPTFMSTAMCTDQQVAQALSYFDGVPITLMHCIGAYPAAEWMLNLRAIATLKEKFARPIGYSGHEASVSPSVMAVVLGATAVERHITLDRASYGSDQAASLEPHGFKSLVEQIRKVSLVLGDGVRKILPAEEEVAAKLRYFDRSNYAEETRRKIQGFKESSQVKETPEENYDPNRKVILLQHGPRTIKT
jgi:N-acetylneuraminate synthase